MLGVGIMRLVLLLPSWFYSGWNWDAKSLSHLPEVTQLVSSGARVPTVVLIPCSSLSWCHPAKPADPADPQGPLEMQGRAQKAVFHQMSCFSTPQGHYWCQLRMWQTTVVSQASSRKKNYHGKLIQQRNIWYKSMTVNPRISLFVLNSLPTAARPTTEHQEGTLTRF